MGMLDSNLVFAESQAATAIGDTPSTSSYNAGNAGAGDAGQTTENLWAQAICTTTATSGGNATVSAVLQSSPDNATWTDAVIGPAIPVADLTAGTVLLNVQPPPGMKQYWRFVWRIAVAALTAGAFDAFVSNTLERNIAQPSGFVVK